jgi:hypothetical protein
MYKSLRTFHGHRVEKPEKVFWEDKDGVKHDIDKMDTKHLRNIVKIYAKKLQEIKDNQDYFEWQMNEDLAKAWSDW